MRLSFQLFSRLKRAIRWLLPGLVVKRLMMTSGLGVLIALIGISIWADLRPIYWVVEILFWFLGFITTFLPRTISGPIVFLIGISLLICLSQMDLQSQVFLQHAWQD